MILLLGKYDSVAYLADSNYSRLHLIISLTPKEHPEMNIFQEYIFHEYVYISSKSITSDKYTGKNEETQDFFFTSGLSK